MNREETLRLLSILMANYPNATGKIKDAAQTADAWEMTFGKVETEKVYKAARLHMETSKFFPTPADILEKITRAGILYDTNPNALKAPAKRSSIIPEGMTEDEYLNSIIQAQIELETELNGSGNEYFLPYEL